MKGKSALFGKGSFNQKSIGSNNPSFLNFQIDNDSNLNSTQ